MQNHILIIKQIEVSKNLINEDVTQSLRISLLLLDHAIEILMYRYIEWAIFRNYSKSEKEMPYSFPEKVKLLIEKNAIGKEIGDFIVFSHRYRNEIYHQDKLRKETIKPLVLVLFKVTCDLFSKLELGIVEYTNNLEKDLKEYQAKYDLPSLEKLHQDSFIKIVEKINKDISISTKDIKSLLIKHIENRIGDIKRDTSFVLKENKNMNGKFSNDPLVIKVLNLNLASNLEIWNREIRDIDNAGEEIKIFSLFDKLELKIEKIEKIINPAVKLISEYEDIMYEVWRKRDI